MNQESSSVYPFDFSQVDLPPDPKLAFLISPINAQYDEVYRFLREILDRCDFRCIRADKDPTPGVIHSMIWENIRAASVIIVDVSEPNPNVYYELGVAASWKHASRIIPVRNAESCNKPPFDIGPIRYINYDLVNNPDEFRRSLRGALETVRRDDEKLWAPMDAYDRWKRSDYSPVYLLDKTTLSRLEQLPWMKGTDPSLRGFCLASALQHSHRMHYWTKANAGNEGIIEGLAALFRLPYRAPRVRAAYAMRFIHAPVRAASLKALRRVKSRAEDTDELLNAVASDTVRNYVSSRAEAGEQRFGEILRELDHWDHF